MQDDLISRQAVLDLCDSTDPEYKVIHFKEDVECLPSVQPEQKTGYWIDTGSGQECSLCGEIQYGYDNFRRFCASCGAKMEIDGRMKYKTIDNPCYHCYTGAIGECAMIGCKYLLKPWSQDLESETIEILNQQIESEEKK